MPTSKKPKRKVRRVVIGTGQPWYDPKSKRLELMIADFVSPARIVRLKLGGLGPWNRIRLVAEVLK